MTRQMSCGMVVQDHVGKPPRSHKLGANGADPHGIILSESGLCAIVGRLETLLAHGARLCS